MHIHDAIVIGLGSMGSAALYHLAKRGMDVLGIEQYLPVHQRGSHSGQSRIFRQAYFEHPDYVPLLKAAYKGWHALEAASGRKVFHETGLLYMGQPDHPLLDGSRKSAAQYGIPISEQAGSIHPQFHLPPEFHSLHEAAAGLVLPEATIEAQLHLAEDLGAKVRQRSPVLHWEIRQGVVQIHTKSEIYRARKAIFAMGAYTPHLLPTLAPQLKVTRQLLAYFQPAEPDAFALGAFPCWTLGLKEKPGVYYGFPILPQDDFGNPAALKVALHHVAQPWNDPVKHHQPDLRDLPTELKTELDDLKQLLRSFLPAALGPVVGVQTCLYTNSPDLDFILGPLPGFENHITIAAGFSGHGFKFVPVVGEVLADFAEKNSTDHPVDFLSPARFS